MSQVKVKDRSMKMIEAIKKEDFFMPPSITPIPNEIYYRALLINFSLIELWLNNYTYLRNTAFFKMKNRNLGKQIHEQLAKEIDFLHKQFKDSEDEMQFFNVCNAWEDFYKAILECSQEDLSTLSSLVREVKEGKLKVGESIQELIEKEALPPIILNVKNTEYKYLYKFQQVNTLDIAGINYRLDKRNDCLVPLSRMDEYLKSLESNKEYKSVSI